MRNPLKWLMLCRLLFCSFLLGSTILLQVRFSPSLTTAPLLVLYVLTSIIFLLTAIYAVSLAKVRRLRRFAGLQVAVDTLIVSLILFVTGGFFSVFSFLYLIVIVYGTILLGPRGGRWLAAGCCLQYICMVAVGYQGWLLPPAIDPELQRQAISGSVILYRVTVTTLACFGVAFLSGLLVDKANRSHLKLMAMEDHVKRVDRMAAIGEMAAGLAHEIKNPLASLGGAIQMLREEIRYQPEHERLMHIVLRETDRLSSLVNNFLMFAKPTQGRVEYVALDGAVRETLALFEKDKAIFGKVSIHQSLTADVWVEIDPVHLRQVLWNLLLNAAEAVSATSAPRHASSGETINRAMHHQSGLIDVQMKTPGEDEVVLSIEDNGEGMSKETVATIFDPFFTTKPEGTGLGLSIVHRILESYQAPLDVYSRPGQGSRFSISFRRTQAPA
ncbi:MAG: ATP-binding protein [Desulfosarcinaceae bacterium]|nr:ATP-binding protein [Desulfosarcinaceae bacterium]